MSGSDNKSDNRSNNKSEASGDASGKTNLISPSGLARGSEDLGDLDVNFGFGSAGGFGGFDTGITSLEQYVEERA